MDTGLIQSLKAVWKAGFGDDDSFIDYYFTHYDNAGNRSMRTDVLNDCRAVALMHFHRFTDAAAGIDGAYIYGVTTLPRYRRRGLARDMMRESLAHMAADGVCYAVLIAEEPSLRKWYATMDFVLRPDIIEVNGAADGMNFAMDDASLNSGMYRVADARLYLSRYARIHAGETAHIQLSDPIIPQNSGIYHVSQGSLQFTPHSRTAHTVPQLTMAQLVQQFPLDFTRQILIDGNSQKTTKK